MSVVSRRRLVQQTELSGASIAAITTAIKDAPARCKMIIVPLGGAVSRVGLSDTAFALRQPGFEVDTTGVWSALVEKAEAVRWIQATRDSMLPFAHGVYLNQLGETSDQLNQNINPNNPSNS